jgi:pimeloyl-ACP methyl ester carboxylesterase
MSKYLELRGHQVFSYEWANNGEALVLLHGGLSYSEKIESYLLPAVSETHHVFAYDRTGHGRTGNQEGSIHFEFQTNELIAYLEDVVKEPAHLIGVSDGGNIALMAAIARPDLIRSIITIGANSHFSQVRMSLEVPIPSIEEIELHTLLSPDPLEELEKKIARAFEVWKSEPNLTPEDLSKITCPALILAGDDDVLSASESNTIYEAIENARLAIVPGASHAVIKEKTGLVHHLIKDFYENPNYPSTRDPIRRRYIDRED